MTTYSPTGWIAHFEHGIPQPVESWSPAGDALVVDRDRAALRPAAEVDGFQMLTPCSRIVSVVPAAPGWSQFVHSKENRNIGREQAIALWLVLDDGSAVPLSVSDEGSYYVQESDRGGEITPPK